jgi:predicted transcriptional regulator
MTDKATMTLNLSASEMAVVDHLAKAKGLSKTALLRQALRLYQEVDARLSAGETMHFSGDAERVQLLLVGL